MVSDQVYRKRRCKLEAFQELRAHVNTQFDPDLVDLFNQCVADRDAELAK
jgi:HD-GYP domain-containing protein (c-di-GMP phosphodiesterase class II)